MKGRKANESGLQASKRSKPQPEDTPEKSASSDSTFVTVETWTLVTDNDLEIETPRRQGEHQEESSICPILPEDNESEDEVLFVERSDKPPQFTYSARKQRKAKEQAKSTRVKNSTLLDLPNARPIEEVLPDLNFSRISDDKIVFNSTLLDGQKVQNVKQTIGKINLSTIYASELERTPRSSVTTTQKSYMLDKWIQNETTPTITVSKNRTRSACAPQKNVSKSKPDRKLKPKNILGTDTSSKSEANQSKALDDSGGKVTKTSTPNSGEAERRNHFSIDISSVQIQEETEVELRPELSRFVNSEEILTMSGIGKENENSPIEECSLCADGEISGLGFNSRRLNLKRKIDYESFVKGIPEDSLFDH